MENLLNKSIQAIKDGKNDYAIGLLEGILEMNGKERTHSNGIAFKPETTEIQRKVSGHGGLEYQKPEDGEADALNALAKAKLAGVIKASNIEVL